MTDKNKVVTLEEGKSYIVGKKVNAWHSRGADKIEANDVITVMNFNGCMVHVILEWENETLSFNKIVLEQHAWLILQDNEEEMAS